MADEIEDEEREFKLAEEEFLSKIPDEIKKLLKPDFYARIILLKNRFEKGCIEMIRRRRN